MNFYQQKKHQFNWHTKSMCEQRIKFLVPFVTHLGFWNMTAIVLFIRTMLLTITVWIQILLLLNRSPIESWQHTMLMVCLCINNYVLKVVFIFVCSQVVAGSILVDPWAHTYTLTLSCWLHWDALLCYFFWLIVSQKHWAEMCQCILRP